MKVLVSSLVVCLIVLGSAVGLYVRQKAQSSALQSARQAAAIEELSARLETLGERLAGVEREARNERSAAPAAPPVATTSGEAATGSPDSAAGVDEPEGSEPAASDIGRRFVATLGADGERQLRGYVRQVYLEERNARREREAAEAVERQKELEAMRQGPYGKYNLRVNTLGKQLALDERQKQLYHGLLETYSARQAEMRKAVDWKDQGQRQQFHDSENALQAELDAHVARLLNQTQAAEYAEMPAGEKSLPGGGMHAELINLGLGEGGVAFTLPDIVTANGRVEAAVRKIRVTTDGDTVTEVIEGVEAPAAVDPGEQPGKPAPAPRR